MNVTTSLILINVAVYAWMVATGTNFGSNDSLLAHGALEGWLVRGGQWWRIVSGAFEHAGLWHIALNMFALYQLGTFVEGTLGARRMLAIYAVSLLGGGLAVTYFAPSDVTVGASGAIFGLFGALLAIGVRLGKRGRNLIMQVVPILVINLVFTFAIPFISKAGHVGGLLSGFLITLPLVALRRRPPEPVVVDAATGVASDAEYLAPGEEPQPESKSPLG